MKKMEIWARRFPVETRFGGAESGSVMKPNRQYAKERLEHSTLDEYNNLINQARLSNRQRYILQERLSPRKRYNYQIAMDLEISPETIRDELADAYDRVSKLLGCHNGDYITNLRAI